MSGLGLSAYHAGSTDFVPRCEWNAKSGRLHIVNRAQGADGAFANDKVDVTSSNPAFALDTGSIEIGWLCFPPGGAPMTDMVPYGQLMPERPGANFKAGFKVMIWNPRDFGPVARELKSNAGAVVAAIEELWDLIAATPQAAAGEIPVVQLVGVKAITGRNGTNYAPDLRLLKWIARDERVFGPRTVAAPGARRPVAPPPRHAPAWDVGQPADDRWGDDIPARVPAMAGYDLDDEIPF